MPEYFGEVNPHRSNIQRSRSAVGDVKEVWFAGCHYDMYVYRFTQRMNLMHLRGQRWDQQATY